MLPLTTGTWTLDPAHSVVQFSIRHLGISTIRGTFRDVAASVEVGETLSASRLTATIGMGSIDTGNSDRDNHVRSTDIFDADTNPQMSFDSAEIADSDGHYRVQGTLSLHGNSRLEVLQVTFYGTESNPLDESVRAGFSASATIDRTMYGIDWNVPLPAGGLMLGNRVDIQIDAQLIGPTAT